MRGCSRKRAKSGQNVKLRLIIAAGLLFISAALMIAAARAQGFADWYAKTVYPLYVGDLPFFSVRGHTIYTDRGIFRVACGTCSKTDPRVVSRASCLLEFYGSSYSGDPCVSLCVMLRDQLSENVVFTGGADCDIFLQCGGIGRDLSLAD